MFISSYANFIGSWWAARHCSFYEACRKEHLWPHQVGAARSAADFAHLRQQWCREIHQTVTSHFQAIQPERQQENQQWLERMEQMMPQTPMKQYGDEAVLRSDYPFLHPMRFTVEHWHSAGPLYMTQFNLLPPQATSEEQIEIIVNRYSYKAPVRQKKVTLKNLTLQELFELRSALSSASS